MTVRRRRLDLTTYDPTRVARDDSSVDSINDINYGEGTPDNTEDTQGLSIAMPVPDEEQNVFIPVATEYDPNAARIRDSKFGHAHYMVIITSLMVLVGAIAWGACIALGIDYRQPKLTPTPSETEIRAGLGFQERLELLIDPKHFEDRFNAYSRALWWITYVDPMKILPDDPNLFQRYLLAYLYYATSQKSAWNNCNPPNVDAGEDQYCVNGQWGSGGERLFTNPIPGQIRWLSDNHECSWAGVVCDTFGQVQTLQLSKYVGG
jgi:hypothetical protein